MRKQFNTFVPTHISTEIDPIEWSDIVFKHRTNKITFFVKNGASQSENFVKLIEILKKLKDEELIYAEKLLCNSRILNKDSLQKTYTKSGVKFRTLSSIWKEVPITKLKLDKNYYYCITQNSRQATKNYIDEDFFNFLENNNMLECIFYSAYKERYVLNEKGNRVADYVYKKVDKSLTRMREWERRKAKRLLEIKKTRKNKKNVQQSSSDS